MKLIDRIHVFLQKTVADCRAPDFVIGGAEAYLRRWWVIPRNRFFNIYLHHIRRNDDDRALHDHPYPNASILLAGQYVEHTIRAGGVRAEKVRAVGSVVLRRATTAHRLTLVDGVACWSLFVTGPRVREWGFHCPNGWIPWAEFTDPNNPGAIGKGCGE